MGLSGEFGKGQVIAPGATCVSPVLDRTQDGNIFDKPPNDHSGLGQIVQKTVLFRSRNGPD